MVASLLAQGSPLEKTALSEKEARQTCLAKDESLRPQRVGGTEDRLNLVAWVCAIPRKDPREQDRLVTRRRWPLPWIWLSGYCKGSCHPGKGVRHLKQPPVVAERSGATPEKGVCVCLGGRDSVWDLWSLAQVTALLHFLLKSEREAGELNQFYSVCYESPETGTPSLEHPGDKSWWWQMLVTLGLEQWKGRDWGILRAC